MKKSVTVSTQNSFSIFSALIIMLLFSFLLIASSFAEPVQPAAYSVTASTSGQGDISPSGAVAVAHGASKAFVFNSDANHHIVDIIVDGKSVGPIAAYSFENISTSHTIQAVFESDSASLNASAK